MSVFYMFQDAIFKDDLKTIKRLIKNKVYFTKGQQCRLMSIAIQGGKANIYTYLYDKTNFEYIEMNYSNDLMECIRYNNLSIDILEAVRNHFYNFDNVIFHLILLCCQEHKPEYVRMLYFKYRDIYRKFLYSSVMSYLIQLRIHDVFLDYVEIWVDMKELRKMCDIYQNEFVLKWLYENNKLCNAEKDPYYRTVPYFRVNIRYKYLLGALGLDYDGEKASDQIYVKYMNAMMKMVSK